MIVDKFKDQIEAISKERDEKKIKWSAISKEINAFEEALEPLLFQEVRERYSERLELSWEKSRSRKFRLLVKFSTSQGFFGKTNRPLIEAPIAIREEAMSHLDDFFQLCLERARN